MSLTVLALETSGETCSAALAHAGAVTSRLELSPQGHTRRLLPMIDEILREASVPLAAVDVIVFGRGPGSFTGLRIAAAAVQGLAFGHDLPVIAVSTLAVLAAAVAAPRVAVAVDARMDQVYWGCYERGPDGIPELAGAESVGVPAEVAVPPGTDWVGTGTGWDRYREPLEQRLAGVVCTVVPGNRPDARHLIPFAEIYRNRGLAVAPQDALPVYLRDNVARRTGERE